MIISGKTVNISSKDVGWKNIKVSDTTKALNEPHRKRAWIVMKPVNSNTHWVSVVGNVTGKFPPKHESTAAFVRETVLGGLARDAFNVIRDAAEITTDQLSAVTGIPSRTLQRRETFKPDESERLLRVASAFQKAVEVLEDIDAARRWFSAPKKALGGLTPLKYCDTDVGAREVEALLGRIDHGVFS